MNKALCVGINDYPGHQNDLDGCVNDANDWGDFLSSLGFKTDFLFNSQATKTNILNALNDLITQAYAGDVVVFMYSGHGTSVIDEDADEEDGYDEALYVYDGVLLDDEIREILSKVRSDVQVTLITDSCFSGTVTRKPKDSTIKIKYVETDDRTRGLEVRKKFMEEEDMKEILISGCNDSEYSYDAYINGRYNGAFTANAIRVIEKGQTYNQFYSILRTLLPSSQYPQTPQLEGSSENKNTMLFAPYIHTGVSEDDEQEEQENVTIVEDNKKSWILKYWWVILIIIIGVIVGIIIKR